MNSTKKAYFILVDITGFTSFIAGSELEHSQLILSQILNQIVNRFTPQFELIEIEGDAVFLYAPIEKFSRGEIILEMIESTYFAFRDTKTSFRRLIVCNCNACKMTTNLDLKFIIHSGEYVLNNVAGKFKPMGNSINTLHRLTKNKVGLSKGWNAYMLFTQECMNELNLQLPDIHYQVENYEHIGEVKTLSINLDEKYKNFTESRVEFVKKEEAHYIIQKEFKASPPVLWEWINNPKKRSQWLDVSDWNPLERPFGRTGKDAVNHCANSNYLENLVDYRPFDYYTSFLKGKWVLIKQTGRFEQIPEGTRFNWIMKMEGKIPAIVKKFYIAFTYSYFLKINEAFSNLKSLLEQEKTISRKLTK